MVREGHIRNKVPDNSPFAFKQITLEAAVRVRDIPDGEKIKLTVDVVPEGGFDAALADHLEIELTAVTPQASDIEIDILTPEEPKVESVYARDNSAAPEMAIPVGGALTYVPFDIYLPAEKRVEMEVRKYMAYNGRTVTLSNTVVSD